MHTGVPPGATEAQTLVDLLRQRAQRQPDEMVYLFLSDGEAAEQRLTYAELDARARAIAARLQAHTSGGDRALLLFPAGLDYIAAFFGCLYAGVIAVPVYPPQPSRVERSLPRIRGIVEDARPRLLLMPAVVQPAVEQLLEPGAGGAQPLCLATDALAPEDAGGWRDPSVRGESLAFLQYTSGSTAAPRGVMVSHANLLHNHRMIQYALQHPPGAAYVSWLPLFHDMGLIGNALQALYAGVPCVLLSPMAFLQRPLRWLEAVSRYRAATSGGPNFAYDLCVRQTTPEQRAALDLSCWQLAFNGAEPVRAETLERFAEAFAPAGFRREAFYPCYGLAEATLFVAGESPVAAPTVAWFQGPALDQRRVAPARAGEPGARRLVSCGRPWLEQTLVIADPATGRRCGPDQIGEIWVRGPSVAQGYWGQPATSEQTFQARLADTGEGPFLRTGDLGFIWEGQVFVGGRLKDVIIVRGRNHYPQDIEATVERCHPALRAGAGAACAVDVAGEERLLVVQEVERSALRRLDLDAVVAAVRRVVAEEHELDVYAVALLKPGSLPKTSSGKIQRHACAAGFLAGSLSSVGEWRQPAGPAGCAAAAQAPAAAAIRAWLAEAVARRCQIAPERIEPRQPLVSYGLHSNDLVGLSGLLADWLGRPLAPTLLYDYPTIEALARHLAGEEAPAAQGAGLPAESEPVAVIGIGCRFPGAGSPEALWELLRDGVDAVSEVPPARWDIDALYSGAEVRPGMINTRWGGFLEDVDRFDPAFFGLAPREAEQIDPQQRLLLEVGWEALEHAGVDPEGLAGQPVGVFVGISTSDYTRLQAAGQSDAYSGTGSALSVAAGRLAYLLDLRGPALAVDTACSSSLVALHLACESLRRGESSLALAGGVNLILAPDLSVTLAQAHMLSPGGRCKTFDASADGYVRGEGCGVVVLKRLSDARRDGDTVLALIRGSAVNQDGRSNGLTAPNGLAQQQVIRAALERAGVHPALVGYVEAHGSGTALGDPIEIGALREVLAAGRAPDAPCLVGSLKSNIGHLEAAAGVAGLIKAVLVLRHAEIPPQLHLTELNPHLAIAGTALAIPTARRPWPTAGRRLAGVSSFGFSGTNAHVVLEAAPEPPARPEPDEPAPRLLGLSAKDDPALRALAGRYGDALAARPETRLADLCLSTGVGRAHFAQRLALVAESTGQARELLAAFAAGRQPEGLLRAAARRQPPRLAFLFSGQGAQYAGMGRRLYAAQPVFRAALDRCAELLAPELGLDIRPLIFSDEPAAGHQAPRTADPGQTVDPTEAVAGSGFSAPDGPARSLEQTWLTQPALFALEYGLAELWRAWGVQPDVVLGHSLGEYVAACAAGVFSLEDALRLVVARARLMQALPEGGQMAAVALGEREVAELVAPYAGEASVAAVNGPRQCVIAGSARALAQIGARLAGRGVRVSRLAVSHAFHSPLIEPMLEGFAQAAAGVRYAPPRLPLVSNLTGTPLGDELATPAYWVAHVRGTVRFAAGVAALRELGCGAFVEIGPHPVLIGMVRLCGVQEGDLWLPSLRRGRADQRQMLESLGALYVHGQRVGWRALAGPDARRVELPGYPWQRQRCWLQTAPQDRDQAAPQQSHPLLGRRLRENPRGAGGLAWQVELDSRRLAYLADHRIGGAVIVPAAAYVEMALGAAAQAGGGSCRLADLALHQPLALADDRPRTLQITLTPQTDARSIFRVYALPAGAAQGVWVLHASAAIDRDQRYP